MRMPPWVGVGCRFFFVDDDFAVDRAHDVPRRRCQRYPTTQRRQ